MWFVAQRVIINSSGGGRGGRGMMEGGILLRQGIITPTGIVGGRLKMLVQSRDLKAHAKSTF